MNEKTAALLHQLVDQKIVPGVSYAMICQDDIQTEVFGNKQLVPTVKPLEEGALYDLASLTKVIGTTTVILQLLEAKKLRLDDRVAKYLPRFTDQRVTLRHLLTHTSALSGYIKNRDQLPPAELMAALYTLKPAAWLGKKVVYADIGLILLGQIIEAFYHRPVQAVITTEVLRPLGMKASTFTPEKKQCVPTELTATRGLIQGEVHDPKAFILGEHCGSAGLFSNLADLIKFAKWMLAPQTIPGVLAPETVAMLYADHTPTHDLGRSLGWDLRYDRNNTPCLYHTGFTGTFMLLDQKGKNALIVLSNRVHPSADNEAFLAWRDKIIATYLAEKD
ncbi:beta-lactamase family protein [Ligilactobacillus animalis]|nr:beta-lactamase family protein [Ligilactobacillus animalis]